MSLGTRTIDNPLVTRPVLGFSDEEEDVDEKDKNLDDDDLDGDDDDEEKLDDGFIIEGDEVADE